MHLAATRRGRLRAGFLHVPCLRSRAPGDAPAMALDDIVRGLEIVLEVAAEEPAKK